MANNQPGMPGMRPVGGSSSNLAGQGVAMVNSAIMAQFAAAGGQLRPGQLPAMGMQGMPAFTPQQMHVYLQHQQALQMAAGRAASPGGVQIYLRSDPSNPTSQLVAFPLPAEFVAAKQALIQQCIGNVAMHPAIKAELDRWNASREASSGAGSDQPAAKRAKVDGPTASAAARPAGVPLMQHPAALAAMAGGRPPLPPGMALPGMIPQPVSASQASAAAQLRLQQQLAAKHQFQPILKPQSEDDRQFVPQARLQALVRQVGLGIGIQNAKATEDAEGALRAVAGDFIGNAVSFAVAMARRRKSEEIEPADLLLYLERTWGLQVPGFSGGEIKPYQRQPASAEHQRRMAAVRKAMATSAAGSGAGGAAAGTPAAPAAVGAADKQQQAGGAGGAGPSAAAAAAANGEGEAAAAPKGGGAGKTPAKQQQQQAHQQAQPQQQQQQQPEKQAVAAAAGGEDDDMPDLDAPNGTA